MNDFYVKMSLSTKEPIKNTENLIISLGTIEFQTPKLLRLDFSKTKRYINKRADNFCEIELYGYEFDYDTFKKDYEKLGLEVWNFSIDYFNSILYDSLNLTEIMVDCVDRNNPESLIPMNLDKIQLVFQTDIGESAIDFTDKVTDECKGKLAYSKKLPFEQLVETAGLYSENGPFCETFGNALMSSFVTDDEKPERMGKYALKAICKNSFDDFLVAICGWSLKSLMKKALIIPDEDFQFHNEVVDAIYVSIWDNDVRCEAPCKVNTKTREIFDIEHNSDSEKEEAFECDGEFVMIDDVEFPAIPKDEYESGHKLAFWYGEDE